jgi:hypothetical protein
MVVDWPEPAQLSTNRSLLKWLEAGSEAATSGGMALGDYELHAHPDLVDRLVGCTKDAQVELVAAFGIPCVATSGGVIIAFARGTNTIFVRGVRVGSPVRLEGLDREWEGVDAFFPPEWKEMPLDERRLHQKEDQRTLLLHIQQLLKQAATAAIRGQSVGDSPEVP